MPILKPDVTTAVQMPISETQNAEWLKKHPAARQEPTRTRPQQPARGTKEAEQPAPPVQTHGRPKSAQMKEAHVYSPAIAKLLNEKQPDVAGAALFHNLSLWQKNKYQQTLIDGRRYAFRSLNELTIDCPYLTRSAINKALKRLESKLGNGFLVRKDKSKGWYSISDALLKKQARDKTISFRPDDAVKCGNIRGAVLLKNIEYALQVYDEPKQDHVGKKYARMSPRLLSHFLGFSEDTISRTLKDLTEVYGVLTQHPEDPLFYAFSGNEDCEVTSEFGQNPFAEVNTDAAEVNSTAADVNTDAAKVDAYEGTDSNECGNQCGKEDSKGNCIPRPAPPSRTALSSSLSPGLLQLQQLSMHKLERMRERMQSRPRNFKHPRVHPDELHDNYIGEDNIDLSQDEYANDMPFKEWLHD